MRASPGTRLLRSALAFALALPLAEPVAAGSADEREVADELKAIEDPSILKRRAWVDTEWSNFKDSSNELDFTFGALWCWRISDNQDWGLRLKVPVNFHVAGNTVGDSSEQGLGDIKLAAGTAFRPAESWRTALGLEMRFPTASDHLGANAWRPQLFGVVAWDVTPTVTFSPSAEYNKSIKELRGAAPQEFLEMFFPVTVLLPGRWSVTPRYEAKIDFANDNRVTHSGKFSATKLLEDQPLALTVSLKKTFDGGEKRFQLNFVVTRYFR
jgi:hypothetical protein